MTILLVGGGSGGHITPVLAVAEALKQKQPNLQLVFVIGKGDKLADIPKKHPAIDEVVTIRAGKWRRYHGEGWRQLLDLPTLAKNIRDIVYVFFGLIQSWRLIRRYRPDGIFIKGGFVGVPVGLVAGWRHVAYVTHDSDAIPGLANRIIARRARRHAVGMPVEVYNYPAHKTVRVGVPVDNVFQPPTKQQQANWRQELGIPLRAPVICLTGGGNGSELLNNSLIEIKEMLWAAEPELVILHIAGRLHEASVKRGYQGHLAKAKVLGFTDSLYKYTGVADVVVTRAGATTLADLARQQRACIVVPNPILTGGHQLKNAQALQSKQAIEVIEEATLRQNPTILAKTVIELIKNTNKRQKLAARLAQEARPEAASELADLLLKTFKIYKEDR